MGTGKYAVFQIAQPNKGNAIRLFLQGFDTYREALEMYTSIKDRAAEDFKYIQTSVESPTGEILELYRNHRWTKYYTL